MSWQDWPVYSAQCRRDVQRLLRNGTSLTAYKANPKHGPEPQHGSWAWKLEREAERVHGVRHVVACVNGTVALEVLLKVLYPRGGEIITTAFTFSATVTAIIRSGCIPVFADVTLPSMILCNHSVHRMTTTQTVGHLPVDLFGAFSWGCGKDVVDACQSVGLPPRAYHGVWSFNGRKNVPAGEGGAIFTGSDRVAETCRLRLNHAENFQSLERGINGHLNEVTACIAYHGMRHVRQRNAHRTKMAKILNDALALTSVITPDLTDHALYMYPLIVEKDIEQVADKLFMQGVPCQRGYIQPPLHHYPSFKYLRRDELPNTEVLSRDRLLLFPQVTPTATRREMEDLGDKIRGALI